jgi:hypothetical protein
MHGRRTRTGSAYGTTRRFVMASAIAGVVTATFLPGSGFGSSLAGAPVGQMKIPAGLRAAIHARFGARAIRSSAAAQDLGTDLGISVALSADGTTALVGAPGVAGDKGAAYIFHTADAGAWSSSKVPTATLMSKKGPARGLFGITVALSADGTTAFVGAPAAGKGLLGTGAIYVFHASAEDAWTSSSSPTATLTVNHGIFVGISLASSSDGATVVAGAPFLNGLAGGAYVFHVSLESAWATSSTPTATLTDGGQSQADGFAGAAVALSGDGTTALVSDDGNPNGGGAYVFHVAAAGSWASNGTPTAILSNAASGKHDSLGSVVAISGDGTVAVLGAHGVGSNVGAADVFHSSGEASWATTSNPNAILSNAGGSPGDLFGDGVTVSADGTTAVVTAYGVHSKRGAAYVFHAAGEGSWASSSTPATLTNSGAHAKDVLGNGAAALSTDGATVLVGAWGVDASTGAAYIFHVADESSWASASTPNATLTDDALAACVVPKLKGLKVPAAKTALAVGRCRLGKVSKVRSHSRRKKGHVLSQNRKPGRRLAIGAKIGVKVGK